MGSATSQQLLGLQENELQTIVDGGMALQACQLTHIIVEMWLAQAW